MKFNPEILMSNNLIVYLTETIKHVDNLRSGLAKNALLTL